MKVKELTKQEFLSKVANYEASPDKWIYEGDKPCIVDFFATWCGPCKMMHPILEQLKEKMGDDIRILKVDVDKNEALSMQYRIQSVPTLMLFKKGEMLWRQSGAMSLNDLMQKISQQQ